MEKKKFRGKFVVNIDKLFYAFLEDRTNKAKNGVNKPFFCIPFISKKIFSEAILAESEGEKGGKRTRKELKRDTRHIYRGKVSHRCPFVHYYMEGKTRNRKGFRVFLYKKQKKGDDPNGKVFPTAEYRLFHGVENLCTDGRAKPLPTRTSLH